jgi:hypothetical protein
MAMPTIFGEYHIPAARAGKVLDHLITVVKNHPASFTKADFVREIGAVVTSNGPADKLRDMIAYGLIVDNVQTYGITELGKVAISVNAKERSSAVEKVVRNIPLWNLFINASGIKQTFDTFKKNAHQFITNDPNLDTNIHRLYTAFVEDVACISKTPPYTKISKNLGKPRKHSHQTKPSYEEIPTKLHIETTPQSTSSAVKIFPNGLSNVRLILEFDGGKFEVKDALSIMIAKGLITVKESELKRGDDYEQK